MIICMYIHAMSCIHAYYASHVYKKVMVGGQFMIIVINFPSIIGTGPGLCSFHSPGQL